MARSNDLFHKPRTQIIRIATAILVLGAVLRGFSTVAEHWAALCGIAFYLVVLFSLTVRHLLSLRSISPRERVQALIYLITLYLEIRLGVTGSIGYFTVLVVWAIDYLLAGRRE